MADIQVLVAELQVATPKIFLKDTGKVEITKKFLNITLKTRNARKALFCFLIFCIAPANYFLGNSVIFASAKIRFSLGALPQTDRAKAPPRRSLKIISCINV